MNIVVCIKQVPDTQEIRLDPVTHTLKREGVKAIINPFDLYALEEGLRVKDAQGGQVTVLTMGPPQAEAALREALGYGADAAVLLSDRAFAGADTWATALTLSKAIEKLGAVDLIFHRQAGHRRRHRPGGAHAGRHPGHALRRLGPEAQLH